MNLKISLIIACLLAINCITEAATIIIKADTEVSLKIKKPISGDFNFNYISDEFIIKPGINISYDVSIEVGDYAFVNCEFHIDKNFYILLFENDVVTISYSDNSITAEGSNAKGIQYLNDNYVKNGASHIYDKLEPTFKKHMSAGYNINYEKLRQDLSERKAEPYQSDLAEMERAGHITPKAANVLSKYILYANLCYIFAHHENILRHHKKEIGRENFEEGKREILALYDDSELLKDVSKYRHAGALTDYYIHKFRWSGEEKSEKYNNPHYDADTLGIYNAMLIAPEHIQSSFFGRFLIGQLADKTRKVFDNDKMYDYLTNRFPDSPYLAIARELMKKQKVAAKHPEAVIVKDTISSLKELTELAHLKGNYVYIDLWATWCIPCKREFKYNDVLHNLLSEYNNVKVVYISIDEDKFHNLWIQNVEQIPLVGYNVRTNKSLYDELHTKVYNKESFGIPRYILLDKNGNIINNDLPRPSNTNALKEVLGKILVE